eukprot:CFRG1463T1
MAFRGALSAVRTLAVAGGGILGLSYWSRYYYDSVLKRKEFETKAHKDTTKTTVNIERQVEPETKIWFRRSDGQTQTSVVTTVAANDFIRRRLKQLEERREEIQANIQPTVHRNLEEVFQNFEDRSEKFADWYFSYTTTYKLLSCASTSVARNLVKVLPSGMTMGDVVAMDVVKYLQKKYELIVLRPELNDVKLERAFFLSFQQMQSDYHSLLEDTEKEFRAFLEGETSHTEPKTVQDVNMRIDWATQLNKVNSVVASHEKGPEGAGLGMALTLGGATMGKAVAIGGVKGVGIGGMGKVGGAAAAKGFLAKISAPFVGKSLTAGGAAGGAAAMGMLAGPIGGVIGALAGLGADYSINAGVELLQRESFLLEMREGLNATRDVWEEQFKEELSRVLDVWMSDTLVLMNRYLQEQSSDHVPSEDFSMSEEVVAA